MRRMEDYQETYFTKLAQNDMEFWRQKIMKNNANHAKSRKIMQNHANHAKSCMIFLEHI